MPDTGLVQSTARANFNSALLKAGEQKVHLRVSRLGKASGLYLHFRLDGQGLWQFRIMPLGLCNAPVTFERLMERVLLLAVPHKRCVVYLDDTGWCTWRTLGGVPGRRWVVYLDDVLGHASSFEHNLANLCDVFLVVRLAGLQLNPDRWWHTPCLGSDVIQLLVPCELVERVTWGTPRPCDCCGFSILFSASFKFLTFSYKDFLKTERN